MCDVTLKWRLTMAKRTKKSETKPVVAEGTPKVETAPEPVFDAKVEEEKKKKKELEGFVMPKVVG